MGWTFDDRLLIEVTRGDGTPHPRFDQAEIWCRSVDIDTFIRVNSLTSAGLDLTEANREALTEVLTVISESLISWNLTDAKGKAVPTTLAGLLGRPKSLLLPLVNAWSRAQMDTPIPFERPSTGGGPDSAEIPMEPLTSLPSSSATG